MTKTSRMVGCLLVAALMARTQPALANSDAMQAATPAQMLELANKALAAGQLSPQDRAFNLVRRGFARELLGQRAEALDDFNAAIASSALGADEQATAFYDRGVNLDELSRTEDAIADYSAALKLEPKFAAALNNRGNALRRLGRLVEAERDYEDSMTAGTLHPEYPEFGMGQIAETLGQPSAALEYYRSALAANPQFTLAAERLAAMDRGETSAPASTPIVLTKPGRAVPPPAPNSAPAVIAGAAPLLKPAISETAAAGNRFIQLGAWRTEADANEAWARIQKVAGDLLTSLAPLVIPVDLPGKGRWYRLRIGQHDAADAAQLCGSLKAKGIACIRPQD